MEEQKTYTVLHPVRHNLRLHQRGETISLTDSEAERLLARGVISSGTPVVQVVAGPSAAEVAAEVTASINRLNGMSKAELLEYGQTTYGLTLSSDDKKEALVQSIHDRYLLTLAPAAAGV